MLAEGLQRNIWVCVGPGGVGKTTLSAAIAMAQALSGKKVLCLTIDPARRLAEALSLDPHVNHAQRVHLQELDPTYAALNFHAMMLHPKNTFDDLVRKYSPTPAKAQALLDHPMYQSMATSLAGIHETMAMEQVLAQYSLDLYDVLVLDTPPTTHTLDFLEAPQRLIAAIESPAMRWLSATEAPSLARRWIGQGAGRVLQGLSRFTGAEFLKSVGSFLQELSSMLGGFKTRAHHVSELLRSSKTGFVLVSSTQGFAIEEATFLRTRLSKEKANLDAWIFNRVQPRLPAMELPLVELEGQIATLVQGTATQTLGSKMLEVYAAAQRKGEHDHNALQRFLHEHPRLAVYAAPLLTTDAPSLKALAELGSSLQRVVPSEQSRSKS